MPTRPPSRSTRYSVKPRATADMSERKAKSAASTARKKAVSSRTNRTADKSERVAKKTLATAKSGTTYTTYSKKPRTGGAGADTIASRKGVAGAVQGWRDVRNGLMSNSRISWTPYSESRNSDTGQFFSRGTRNIISDPRMSYSKSTGPAMNAAYKAGQTAKKKAAGAKTAAKKQGYR